MQQTPKAAGVAEHYLRKRIDQGLLTPVGRRNLGRGGVASMLFTPDVLDQRPRDREGPAPLPAEWVTRHQSHLLTVGRAADRVHRTIKKINADLNSGDLTFYLTDGSTRLVDPEVLERWDEDARAGGPVMTPTAAAAHAGVNYETLYEAAQRGVLPLSPHPGWPPALSRARPGPLERW